MSKVTREDVLKLAQLSQLQLTEAEVDQFTNEISAILQYVEQLQGADLDGLAPTEQVTGLKDVMRSDKVVNYGYTKDDLLKNAPAKEDGHFKVKRMVG